MRESNPALSKIIGQAGRHTIIYGIGGLAQSVVGVFLLPLLTGRLTKTDFGAYSLVSVAATLGGAIFYFGMTSALPRSYFEYSDERDRRAVFTTGFVLVSVGAFCMTLLGFWGGRSIAQLLFGDRTRSDAIFWASLGSSFAIVNQYLLSFLRLRRKSSAAMGFGLASLVLGVGLSLQMLDQATVKVETPFVALGYSQMLITIFFLLIYGKHALAWEIKKDEIRKLAKFGFAAVLASSSGMLLDWIDRLIVGHYLTLADVGLYSASVRVGTLGGVIFVAPFMQIWNPLMMEYQHHENLTRLFTLILSYFFLVGAVVVSAASLFSNELLNLLIRSGDANRGTLVFLLVLLGNVIYGSTNIVVAGLFYGRKVSKLSFVYSVLTLINIAINMILVPWLGLTGAALSTMVCSVLVPVVVYRVARIEFGFPIDWWRIAKLTLVWVPPFSYALVTTALHREVIGWGVRVAAFVVSLMLAYLLCLYENERRAIRGFLSRASGPMRRSRPRG